MRVIAGTARSLKLKTPEGLHTRPTQDKHKETLFNCIQNEVPGAVFVDLYSGSGAIGVEALSRGAKKAYFVENDKNALKCIKENLSFTRLADRAEIIDRDSLTALKTISGHIDILFMDPPYEAHAELPVLNHLKDSNLIDEDSLVIAETDFDADLVAIHELGFEVIKLKKYKSNQHVFMRRRVE